MSFSTKYVDLAEHAYGITTDQQRHINQLLQDYDPNLSLRRIPENDPAFAAGMRKNPPEIYGVYEEGLRGASTPWVFTVAEMSIDDRILARVVAGDMSKRSGPELNAIRIAAHQAGRQRAEQEERTKLEEMQEEMLGLARLGASKSTIRHEIDGEMKVISDTIRSGKTFITSSGRR